MKRLGAGLKRKPKSKKNAAQDETTPQLDQDTVKAKRKAIERMTEIADILMGAGDADILNVPDLESGNMLAKQLEYFAGASGAGLVLGSKIPVALTSRADSARTRVASAILGLLVAHAHRQNS